MARWPGGARQRLEDAALRLFAAQGYAATTVDDVAAAAGVTQRTFFRHFPDKEEVLFADDQDLMRLLLDAVAASPGTDPAGHMRDALTGLARHLQPEREQLRLRAGVVATDVGLAGRELAKQARWTAAVADGLRARGYPPGQADLLADVGSAVFRHAMRSWLADDTGPGLEDRVEQALADLGTSFGRATS